MGPTASHGPWCFTPVLSAFCWCLQTFYYLDNFGNFKVISRESKLSDPLLEKN